MIHVPINTLFHMFKCMKLHFKGYWYIVLRVVNLLHTADSIAGHYRTAVQYQSFKYFRAF